MSKLPTLDAYVVISASSMTGLEGEVCKWLDTHKCKGGVSAARLGDKHCYYQAMRLRKKFKHRQTDT